MRLALAASAALPLRLGRAGRLMGTRAAHGAVKRRPYEHLSDAELWSLAGQAADLRLRLAEAEPGKVLEAMMEHGMPKKSALRQIQDPIQRPFAYRFYLDTIDAKLGDPEAKERVEVCEQGWAEMRRLGRQQ